MGEEHSERYNVVYYNPITNLPWWTTYESKEAFEDARSNPGGHNNPIIVAGISREDAVNVCERKISPGDLVDAAMRKATNPKTGAVNDMVLEFGLKTAAIGSQTIDDVAGD